MLSSLEKTSSITPKILVVNTSTDDKSDEVLEKSNIPYINYRGGTHGGGVNLGISKIDTEYVLLVDTDILFLDDFIRPFNKMKEQGLTLMGKVVGDCAGKSMYPRVEPWYCFINVKHLKNNNISFFDRVRHTKRHTEKVDRIYDVGSTMFEDVLNKNLLIGDANMENKYFKHYGGMSWRVQKYNPSDGDTDIDIGGTHNNVALYEYGLKIREQYLKDNKNLDY